MIYRYLPQAKAHLYMYNSAVETKLTGVKKFSTILPKKVTAEEYNQKISKALKEVKNIVKLCLLINLIEFDASSALVCLL